MDEKVEDRIRERAHLIWEREGRPVGRELAHWEQAASELAAEETAAGGTAAEPAPKKRLGRKPKAEPAEGEAAPTPRRRGPAKAKASD